jgi:circadian clock protein KaiC
VSSSSGSRKRADRTGNRPFTLPKVPTGIAGLDEITGGGLPAGRPTLVCGSAGCGKTLLAMEFLARGALEFGEPGVFMSFEETADELGANVRSLGFDLERLAKDGQLLVDHVRVERSEIEETGDYDLEGLFVRLGFAIDSVGAKRVVLDTLESLFSGFGNEGILRAELRRLFRWLKERGVTAVITAERGDGQLTRQGLEEYVSDCVLLLDHRVDDQLSTRRLRIVKYRGSAHGTNEYPFLIDEQGISVLPITSLGLGHPVSEERISTGVPRLDEMLGGGGCFRGSTVLVSGTAGTGKSTLGAHFAAETCARGEHCLYLAYEESPDQIVRNMSSVGVHLEPWLRKGLLRIDASRPTAFGLERHLTTIHRSIAEFDPRAVVVDPITSFLGAAGVRDARAMLTRLVDFLKLRQITGLFTCLTGGGEALEETDVGLSSIVDTWLLLRDVELGGERNRALYILKSRGTAHSNQLREYLITSKGIEILDAYLGPDGVLTGSARLAQEARDLAAKVARDRHIEGQRLLVERKRRALDAHIARLRLDFEAEQSSAEHDIAQDMEREQVIATDREAMARSRKADGSAARERRRRSSNGKGARS